MAGCAPYRADLAARVARFEASIVRVDASRRAFVGRRRVYVWSLLALAAAGFACFAFGTLTGLWGSISAGVVSLAGYGMMKQRTAELTAEVAELKRDLENVRALATRSVPAPGLDPEFQPGVHRG